jgi:cytochrome b subunit of formate dehydrogenase
MRSVRREQRTRKIILWCFGLVGALFGITGALMLAGPLSELFTFSLAMPAMQTMQATLFIVGAGAFYLWFMNDDFSLGS